PARRAPAATDPGRPGFWSRVPVLRFLLRFGLRGPDSDSASGSSSSSGLRFQAQFRFQFQFRAPVPGPVAGSGSGLRVQFPVPEFGLGLGFGSGSDRLKVSSWWAMGWREASMQRVLATAFVFVMGCDL